MLGYLAGAWIVTQMLGFSYAGVRRASRACGSDARLKQIRHPGAEGGQHFSSKPGILLEPPIVPGTRMRQWEHLGPVSRPVGHRLRDTNPRDAEVPELSVSSDDQRHLDEGQLLQ